MITIQDFLRMLSNEQSIIKMQIYYTYHIGQLELLRQLAGKTEKLI